VSRRSLEEAARNLLFGSRLFVPMRSVYQHLFDRKRLDVRRKMRRLYSPFIRRGDIVFDVGAYMGYYTELFSELGARVVAVEPNPDCCVKLKQKALSRDIFVESCAAGDALGKTTLHLCRENPTISTVTDEWYEAAQQSPLHRNNTWAGDIQVAVVTLDHLAERFGVPAFIKIDAEGFDDHVIGGMSFRPRALTFEFNAEIPKVAQRCLQSPVLAEGYEFNYLLGMDMVFSNQNWMQSEELARKLDEFTGQALYGDVFARRIL
jgi:FkbM family methyltransferase